MTAEPQADIVERKFLLVKRGLYYAPWRQGYTGVKDRAGRYLEADAYPPEVVAIHEDDAPMFSPACWPETKAAYYEAEIARLRDIVCLADDLLMEAKRAFPLPGDPLRYAYLIIRSVSGQDYHVRKAAAQRALTPT